MTRKYRVLVLTDHSGHSDQNSIYAILGQMLFHPQCHSIFVASRGLDQNRSFYNELDMDQLYGSRVTELFKYTPDGKYYKNKLVQLQADEFDMVFLRLPRPVTDQFFIELEAHFNNAVIINHPTGIMETSSKKFLLNFPDECPEIAFCQSVEEVIAEANKYPIVLKPLKEYGGKGLIKINGNQIDDGQQIHDRDTFLEGLKESIESDGYLAMKFLKKVSQGDKRILVAGGEILASSLRLPAENSWLCNVAQGGRSVPSEVTEREIEIIKNINPLLSQKGVLIYGADTLVDDNGLRILSEINTLSIGGFPQAEIQTGKPVILNLLNKMFTYADHRSQ